MLDEFELIKRYFTQQKQRHDVVLGVGDDCALVKISLASLLALSIDTLTENIHFFPTIPPAALGYKALAINLSDLAAMGAEPAWATLALTLPDIDEAWVAAFSQGFFQLLDQYQMQLIGGNMSRGPRSVTVQVHGMIPPHKARCRSMAQEGDLIFVSGDLGGASAAVLAHAGKIQVTPTHLTALNSAWYYPQPQIQLGIQLRELANAVIDISDGIAADLQHILTASHKGAELWLNKLPVNSILHEYFSSEQALEMALTGGEDYQLCFTLPKNKVRQLPENIKLTCIGKITAGSKLQVLDAKGEEHKVSTLGYQHF